MTPLNNTLKRQKCEVYSRVVGYLSPVHRWNDGKKSEFTDRRTFNFFGRDSSRL
ncbi:hypothetical protein HZB94_03080 [Candidatus Falkowbacteria bacterium]|nr:hypothetical protein [Candidatus Falkowbacteria bacterium]